MKRLTVRAGLPHCQNRFPSVRESRAIVAPSTTRGDAADFEIIELLDGRLVGEYCPWGQGYKLGRLSSYRHKEALKQTTQHLRRFKCPA